MQGKNEWKKRVEKKRAKMKREMKVKQYQSTMKERINKNYQNPVQKVLREIRLQS